MEVREPHLNQWNPYYLGNWLRGPISYDIAMLSLRYPYFKGRLALPQNGAIPPSWRIVSHRHICAIPHLATYRVRYPIRARTKKFCDTTIATSIARYEKYRCRASKGQVGSFTREVFACLPAPHCRTGNGIGTQTRHPTLLARWPGFGSVTVHAWNALSLFFGSNPAIRAPPPQKP